MHLTGPASNEATGDGLASPASFAVNCPIVLTVWPAHVISSNTPSPNQAANLHTRCTPDCHTCLPTLSTSSFVFSFPFVLRYGPPPPPSLSSPSPHLLRTPGCTSVPTEPTARRASPRLRPPLLARRALCCFSLEPLPYAFALRPVVSPEKPLGTRRLSRCPRYALRCLTGFCSPCRGGGEKAGLGGVEGGKGSKNREPCRQGKPSRGLKRARACQWVGLRRSPTPTAKQNDPNLTPSALNHDEKSVAVS